MSSLEFLPDISIWNTNNVINMRELFSGCSSLKYLPDISKWDMENVKDISFMFYLCSSLIKLPNISKWNTKNIINLNSIFENCSSLTYIPNISRWKLNNKIKINNIFKGCDSLLIIPNVSKWNINLSECSIISSSDYNYIKTVETNSLLSDTNIKISNLSEDSSSLKENNDIKLLDNNNFIDSQNGELDEYYENFYS